MARHSAGLLPYRRRAGEIEMFLVHMGGPYWAAKDAGAWSVAKGEYESADDALSAARREFAEEVGRPAPEGDYLDLGETRLPSGKRVRTFAVETDEELTFIASNVFTMEWPPRSRRMAEFPEVDGAAWYALDEAGRKLVPSQIPILDALRRTLANDPPDE